MKYEVKITEIVEKSLEKIPKKDRLKILDKIDTLADDLCLQEALSFRDQNPPYTASVQEIIELK